MRVRISPAGDSALQIQIAGEHGEPVARVAKLTSRPVEQAQLQGARGSGQRSLFCVDWAAVTGEPAGPVRVAALGGEVRSEPECFADLAALEWAVAAGGAVPDMVVAQIVVPPRSDDLAAAARAVAGDTLALVQGWLASERLAGAQLVVVTRGGIAVGGEAPEVVLAPVWGLVRSAQSEHPGRFLLVDLDEGKEKPDWASLAALREPQLAVRAGQVLAPRLGPAPAPPTTDGAWRLSIERKGALEDLAIIPSPGGDRPLGVHEVRIAVRAAGLNFRDVLIALGMYPGDAVIGSEGAGVVLETGPGVTDLCLGDRVMGLVAGCLRAGGGDRRADDRADPGRLVVRPGGVGAGGVRDRVLRAGGPGRAAGRESRCWCTRRPAGSGWRRCSWPGIWARRCSRPRARPSRLPCGAWALTRRGSPRSRDLGVRGRVPARHRRAGVDVVLDSLAGEFVDASLGLLPRGGRFIEMGKADIRDPEVVARALAGVRTGPST